MADPIGEIVEVNSTGFVAQCLEAPGGTVTSFVNPPLFGSIVKIAATEHDSVASDISTDEPDLFLRQPLITDQGLAQKDVYAVVCHAQTGSLASGRRPRALGMDSEEQMRAEYPQVFELLTTEFRGILIAYTDRHGKIRRYLPPTPPRIHAQVFPCEREELMDLTKNLAFLRFLLAMGQGMPGVAPADTLIAACLRNALVGRPDDLEFLEDAGRILLPMLADDYQRLQGIIESAGAL